MCIICSKSDPGVVYDSSKGLSFSFLWHFQIAAQKHLTSGDGVEKRLLI